MNLVNLARDSFWFAPSIKQADKIGWSTSGSSRMNSDGLVKNVVGCVRSTGSSSTGQTNGVGVFMKAPTLDIIPFRVKAHVQDQGNSLRLLIGYAPATITGTNDDLLEPNTIVIHDNFDEIFMVPNVASGDTYYERPIGFAVQADNVTAANVYMSVQNLAVAPPPFAMGTC